MSSRPDWTRDGSDWPNRDASRFVRAGGIDWHVQRSGEGPTLLLLHGTGGATHSWRDLFPALAVDHDVIALDLPGHGFTGGRVGATMSLPWMARVVGELVEALGTKPALIVGHSAGAAVAIRAVLDRRLPPAPIVALSGALLPFPGALQPWSAGIAKLLFLNPFVPRLLSWHASSGGTVERMLAGTGSRVDDEQRRLYARLFARPAHVEAALAMMANWDLASLQADLPKLAVPLTLVAPAGDLFIPPDVATRVAAIVPGAKVVPLPRLGHLAHEEDPAAAEAIIRAEEIRLGALAGA